MKGLDQVTMNNLDCVKEDINRIDNYDFFGLTYGQVGCGKSTFNHQLCFYVDPKYKNKNIFFKPMEWFKNKRLMQKGSAVNFDEIIEFANARESMKGDNVDFTKELTKIRGLGYFIISAISDLKMLDRFIRESRADVFFYIPQRGTVYVYRLVPKNPGEESVMVKRRKSLLNGEFPAPDFVGHFGDCYDKKAFWKRYMQRKTKYMMQTKEVNRTLIKIQDKIDWIEKNTLTRTRASKVLRKNVGTLVFWEKNWRKNPLKRKIKTIELRNSVRYPIDEINKIGKAYYKSLWSERMKQDDENDV